MRQVGILAAAALYALDHQLDRLATDHANATLLARRLAASPRLVLDLATVQTNIVVFRLADAAPDAATVVERARERGVLLFAFGPRTLRVVTHLDITREQCEAAGQVLAEIAEGRDEAAAARGFGAVVRGRPGLLHPSSGSIPRRSSARCAPRCG